MFKKRNSIAALIFAAAPLAHADAISDYVRNVRFEAGIGVTNYTPQSDGTWYQEGLPHTLRLKAPTISVGFTGPVYRRSAWGVDWHVDYVHLGQISSDCSCTPYDANYDLVNKRQIDPSVPNQNFHGTGHAQGIALTLEPYVTYDGWRFGVEAGIFPYRPTFDETVSALNGTVLAQYPTPHGIQLGRTLGVSVGRGNLRVSFKRYILPTRYDDQHSPAVWRGANTIEVRYVF